MAKYDGHELSGEEETDGRISFDEFVVMFGELVDKQDRASMKGTHGSVLSAHLSIPLSVCLCVCLPV
jgi:hypothetical protein